MSSMIVVMKLGSEYCHVGEIESMGCDVEDVVEFRLCPGGAKKVVVDVCVRRIKI